MNNHGPMEDDRDSSEQLAREDAEQRQWLDEREKEMVESLEVNLKQMFQQIRHFPNF